MDIELGDICILPRNKSFQEIIFMVFIQLLVYKCSIGKDINPDRPRNLAKVVTVE